MTKSGWCMWGGIAVLLLVRPVVAQGGPAATPFKAPVISDTGDLRGPRQPIFFRHDIHAGQDRIPCMYCHYSAAVSSEPGIPSVQTCIGCHQVISGTTDAHRAEITKVRNAWQDAARVDPHLRGPRFRALPPHASHQGARHGPRIVRQLPWRGRQTAAPLSGTDAENGLVHPVPRRAQGDARLHGVPFLMMAAETT